MPDRAPFAEGHEHDDECRRLYAEWRRYDAAVTDTSGRFTRDQALAAQRERDMFERQLRAVGCSGEGVRRMERDGEIAELGGPFL
jgi:DNA relaxase NicK